MDYLKGPPCIMSVARGGNKTGGWGNVDKVFFWFMSDGIVYENFESENHNQPVPPVYGFLHKDHL